MKAESWKLDDDDDDDGDETTMLMGLGWFA